MTNIQQLVLRPCYYGSSPYFLTHLRFKAPGPGTAR